MNSHFSRTGIRLSGLVALALLIRPGQAEVFERDWKEPGDGLLTFDDANNREWLDLPVSLLSQFPEPHFNNAVAEVRAGGLFEGFTFATAEDVRALAESAGIDTSTLDYDVNIEPVMRLVDLLGVTNIRRPGVEEAFGFTKDIGPPPHFGTVSAALWLDPPLGTGGGFAGLRVNPNQDRVFYFNSGVFLYRHAIPEPSSLTLGVFMFTIVGAAGIGRRFLLRRIVDAIGYSLHSSFLEVWYECSNAAPCGLGMPRARRNGRGGHRD